MFKLNTDYKRMPDKIFRAWFCGEKYTQYKTLTALERAYEKRIIKGGKDVHNK